MSVLTPEEAAGVLGSIGRLHLANRQLAHENQLLRAKIEQMEAGRVETERVPCPCESEPGGSGSTRLDG